MLQSKPIWFKQFVRHCSGCLMKVKILHLLNSLQLLLILFFVIWSQKALNLPCPSLFYLPLCHCKQQWAWELPPGLKQESFSDISKAAVISASSERCYSAGDGNRKDPQMTVTKTQDAGNFKNVVKGVCTSWLEYSQNYNKHLQI